MIWYGQNPEMNNAVIGETTYFSMLAQKMIVSMLDLFLSTGIYFLINFAKMKSEKAFESSST